MYFDEEKKETLLELFELSATSSDAEILEPENKWAMSSSIRWLKRGFCIIFMPQERSQPRCYSFQPPREKVGTRDIKRQKRRAKTSGYIFKSDLCALKFPLLMLDRPLWGASTCRSRWETHLYFLKSRKGTERGRSIADRTCILNVTVRWLNRPLWGHCNSRFHTIPALTGSSHPPHTRHTRHLTLFRRDAKLQR